MPICVSYKRMDEICSKLRDVTEQLDLETREGTIAAILELRRARKLLAKMRLELLEEK